MLKRSSFSHANISLLCSLFICYFFDAAYCSICRGLILASDWGGDDNHQYGVERRSKQSSSSPSTLPPGSPSVVMTISFLIFSTISTNNVRDTIVSRDPVPLQCLFSNILGCTDFFPTNTKLTNISLLTRIDHIS